MMTLRRLLSLLLVAPLLLQGCKGGSDGSSSSKGKEKQSSKDSKSGGDSKSGSGKGGSGKAGGSSSGGGSSGGGTNSKSDEGSVPTDSVKISTQDQSQAGITIAQVIVRRIPQVLPVAGQVMMDEKHTDHIGAIADGRIERVFVLPGDNVRAGQTLATLHSHSVHETVSALTQAYAAVQRQQGALTFANQSRDRYSHLYSIQAASMEESQRAEQQVQQARQDLTDAEANVRMEREHLSELLQVPPERLTLAHLLDTELIPVRAVAAGSVITRNVTPGQVVNTGDETFVVSNLTTVWVTASVNEKDLSRVHIGEGARLTTQGYGDRVFRGRVMMLGDTLDPQTRTVPVRVAVPNPGTKLRPGMFATVNIEEPATRDSVFVPQDSLQDVNGLRVVFVTTDGQTFQVRAVKLGTQSEGLVEVTEGLQPGDHVVVQGAFMVKSELLKGSVGEG